MADLNQQITEAKEKIQQYENREKRLLNQIKNEQRHARTHRLIERGAILESLLDGAEDMTGEQVRDILAAALHTEAAREALRKIRAETKAGKNPVQG